MPELPINESSQENESSHKTDLPKGEPLKTEPTKTDLPPTDLPRTDLPKNGSAHPPAPAAPPAEQSQTSKKNPHRWWIWALAALVILAAGSYLLWPKTNGPGGAAPGNAKGKKGGKGSAAANTPVTAARARRGNIGVYVTGLGSVTPLATVTLKSRVDGELMAVHYREGDTIHKGDPLIEIDPRPYQAALTQAEGTLEKDQATLENARIDLTRYQTLLKQKAIPEQQVATQQATVGQSEGTVKTDQGQVDNAKLNLVYTKIVAPITGRIGLRLVDPGNIVHASDSNGLLVITQMDPISVLFTVAEDQLPVILQRMRGQALNVDIYDRDLKQKLVSGSLSTVDNEIDQSTGTVRMRATVNNGNNILFPNQFVNARLLVQEKRGVVLLNAAGIQRNSDTTFVYLIKPDSTVTVRQIQVGTTEGSDAEIVSGLQPGDEVVMAGADKLEEGSKVNAQVSGEDGKGKGGAKSGANKQSKTAPVPSTPGKRP